MSVSTAQRVATVASRVTCVLVLFGSTFFMTDVVMMKSVMSWRLFTAMGAFSAATLTAIVWLIAAFVGRERKEQKSKEFAASPDSQVL